MNICIIGDGLTSLSLAKNLVNKKVKVHLYQQKKVDSLKDSRTIGITKNNLEFFKKEIQRIPNKNIWAINKIEIFSGDLKKDKILNFEKNKINLFYMIKNYQFYKLLNGSLSTNKLFKRTIIKDNFYEKLIKKKKYDLIINCESNNDLSKKYFTKQINKDYYNIAYATTIVHEKKDNKTAVQVFTKFGPIAYLPISKTQTSVVCSLEVKNKNYSDLEIIDLINTNSPKLKIKRILKLNNFKLKSSSLRNYYFKNILAFGDLLHKVHPLAGQGFNMTIRDIKILSKIVQNKIDLGMQLDSSIQKEFEKEARHLNFTFSSGIDLVYEFFHFKKNNGNKKLDKIFNYIGKNKIINNALIRLADRGLNIY